jgi:hypothetical protein
MRSRRDGRTGRKVFFFEKKKKLLLMVRDPGDLLSAHPIGALRTAQDLSGATLPVTV